MRTTPGGVAARVDSLQRQHAVLGFPYAVARKYADDQAAREAALITYYGFLSLFPALLLAVTVVSRFLAEQPELLSELVDAIVPPSLQPDVEDAVASLPTSTAALAVGLAGLLVTGAGVMVSAGHTVNHVADVPFRLRFRLVSRYLRAFAVLALVLAGAVAAGTPSVLGVAVPLQVATSLLVVCAVLLLGARLLLARPAPVRALWPAAVVGAVAVTLTVSLGAAVLPGLVRRAGAVYGSFATAAGAFALLYVLSQALVIAAELAAVRHARLWPRGVDRERPTDADLRARGLLVRRAER